MESELGRRRLQRFIYAEDDRSLANVLLDELRVRDLTIAIAEAGTGGRFGSLLLSEPGVDRVVLGARAAAGTNGDDAAALAEAAIAQFQSDLGIGIAARLAPAPQGLYEGAIEVAGSGSAPDQPGFASATQSDARITPSAISST